MVGCWLCIENGKEETQEKSKRSEKAEKEKKKSYNKKKNARGRRLDMEADGRCDLPPAGNGCLLGCFLPWQTSH